MERQSRTCHMNGILEGTVFSTKADHQTQLHTAGPTCSMLKSFISLAGTNHCDYKACRKKMCFNFCTQEKNYDQNGITGITKNWPLNAFPFWPLRSQQKTCETATPSQCHLHNVLAVNHQKLESWLNSTKVSQRKRHIANPQRFFSTNITFQALTTYPQKKIRLRSRKARRNWPSKARAWKASRPMKVPFEKKKSSGPCLQDDEKLLFAPLLTDKGICGWGWRSAIPCTKKTRLKKQNNGQRVFLWGFLFGTYL